MKDVSTHSRATSGNTSIFHASSVNNRADDESEISQYKPQLLVEELLEDEESYDFEANLKEREAAEKAEAEMAAKEEKADSESFDRDSDSEEIEDNGFTQEDLEKYKEEIEKVIQIEMSGGHSTFNRDFNFDATYKTGISVSLNERGSEIHTPDMVQNEDDEFVESMKNITIK